jgi:hypothetical protein
MHEIVVNIHMHTSYSDGFLSHPQIAQAALQAGLDAVIVTDHNVWVKDHERYYEDGERSVLMLVGEEIHDQARNPQKNHLLVFGANRELATFAHNTDLLLENVRRSSGISFLAHPVDPAAPAVGEGDISWVDWQINGFTGIEIWNGFSEFKSKLKSMLHAVYYIYNPDLVARGPFPETLKMWDKLLSSGKKVPAVGGSDAHALPARLGPLKKTVFPFDYHFRAINTHLFLPKELSGRIEEDKKMILDALRFGRGFIGYDLPASTKGFRFTANGTGGNFQMGDDLKTPGGVTLQIRLPMRTECNLLKDGVVIKTWTDRENCTHITSAPGVYRVEVYIEYKGKRRGWIYSNPIYLKFN